MPEDTLAAVLIKNTEAVSALSRRVHVLELAMRELATLGIRATLVLGRSVKGREDLLEAARIQEGVRAILESLIPDELRAPGGASTRKK